MKTGLATAGAETRSKISYCFTQWHVKTGVITAAGEVDLEAEELAAMEKAMEAQHQALIKKRKNLSVASSSRCTNVQMSCKEAAGT